MEQPARLWVGQPGGLLIHRACGTLGLDVLAGKAFGSKFLRRCTILLAQMEVQFLVQRSVAFLFAGGVHVSCAG